MRNLVLAMLAKEPIHGYELKLELEAALGRLWPPINMGQVYVTLRRLERDRLVKSTTVEQSDRPDKRVYELTASGHEVLTDWIQTTDTDYRLRDGFFLQLVAALVVPNGPDVSNLIDRQRHELLRQIRQVQALEDDDLGLTERIAVDGTLLHLQAELRWLELCESNMINTSIQE